MLLVWQLPTALGMPVLLEENHPAVYIPSLSVNLGPLHALIRPAELINSLFWVIFIFQMSRLIRFLHLSFLHISTTPPDEAP